MILKLMLSYNPAPANSLSWLLISITQFLGGSPVSVTNSNLLLEIVEFTKFLSKLLSGPTNGLMTVTSDQSPARRANQMTAFSLKELDWIGNI